MANSKLLLVNNHSALKSLLVLVCCCAMPTICYSGHAHSPIILASYSEEHKAFMSALSQILGGYDQRHIKIRAIDQAPQVLSPLTAPKLILAIGENGLKKALSYPSRAPIVSCLLHKHNLDILIREHPKSRKRVTGALFLDHPISRQFDLIQSIAKQRRTPTEIGVILSPNTLHLQEELSAEAAKRDLPLAVASINEKAHPLKVLQHLLNDITLLLAVPDPLVFNRKTARSMLMTSYRHGIPVVGYSKAYVHVGALAAVYSSTHQHAQEVANLLLDKLFKFNIEPLSQRYPAQYSVAINYKVAHSMAFNIPHTNSISDQMKQIALLRDRTCPRTIGNQHASMGY